ncbi:hypothetical protein C349_04736 [Cryptococcus neoformans var. grubii Br795]|nr:hypothetical protein C349_04736 [Cryptococcus neoformans var. grubii Br795]
MGASHSSVCPAVEIAPKKDEWQVLEVLNTQHDLNLWVLARKCARKISSGLPYLKGRISNSSQITKKACSIFGPALHRLFGYYVAFLFRPAKISTYPSAVIMVQSGNTVTLY